MFKQKQFFTVLIAVVLVIASIGLFLNAPTNKAVSAEVPLGDVSTVDKFAGAEKGLPSVVMLSTPT